MRKSDCLLVAFGSWEDRFAVGFRRDLERVGMRRALVLYFGEYENRTEANRKEVQRTCDGEEVECVWCRLNVTEPARNWQAVAESVGAAVGSCSRVVVDISTMPREVIWYVLWLLEQETVDVSYVYHSPENYGKEWLSRDPRAPRLVYKLSGMSLPAKKTALLVTAGFDLQRAVRLIEWCEPAASRDSC